jgi:hypothetical protein
MSAFDEVRIALARSGPRPGTRGAIEAAIASVPECRAVSFTETPEYFAVEVEIEGPTMAAVRLAASLAEDQVLAGVAFSWIPAGEAARELEREAQGVAPDWRPGDLMPEDYFAR